VHCNRTVTFSAARLSVDAEALQRYPVRIVPSAYDLDRIRAKLADRQPVSAAAVELADSVASSSGLNTVVEAGPAPHRKAAVATILRPGARETEVLLIRRAERAGDPWSGHMAFPGGHQDPGDPNLYATAMRETLEEVGLDLNLHEYLGQLDELPATIRGLRVGISIAPHVFALRGPVELQANYEVAEIVWTELGPMARGEVDDVREWRYEGGELQRAPAFRVQGHIVWGLTHRMLMSLFDVLA
jgi:8-oxo-dGTP pyrophosphatase MutT (NUDIX family)